jgi:hypothetical protein
LRLLLCIALGCTATTSLDDVFGPPPCGSEGVACCSNATCTTGLACRNGECLKPVPCGGDGEGCCNGTSCNMSLRCDTGSCSPIPPPPPAACGGAGQACCATSACNAGLVCQAGKCVACGSYQQPCCAGGGCRGDTACVESICRACCVKCKNRELYHRVFVNHDCYEAGRDYCASGDRGGIGDAKWGTCQAF